MKNMTMQEAFDKAINAKTEYCELDFIDADVYMDANTYGMTQEQYLAEFDKLANEWENK